jgi:hypothetical protein
MSPLRSQGPFAYSAVRLADSLVSSISLHLEVPGPARSPRLATPSRR